MALDQTSVPKELRPINVATPVSEDPRISVHAVPGRPIETGSPNSVPVYFPPTLPESGFVGAGYGTQVPGVATWCPRPLAPVGHVGIGSAGALGYGPDLGNRVVLNAHENCSTEFGAGFGYNQGLSMRDCSSGSERSNVDAMNRNCGDVNLGIRTSGNGADTGIEDGGDDSVSGKKVKFLCSFGGKIWPRPSDGVLRYVGGQTRIISVQKNVRFIDLEQKMFEVYGQPVVIKYQLPDEDLDALVSVSCPEDLDNMMEEYEKLLERSPDGSAKLRVFLFSASEVESLGAMQFGDALDSGQRYVEAVNGVVDGINGGITRKESIASASSNQNSDYSATDAVDSSGPGQSDFVAAAVTTSTFAPPENLVTSNDNAARTVPLHPDSSAYADNYAIPMAVPVARVGPSQPEVVSEKQMPPVNIQQPTAAQPLRHSQAYVDPRLQVFRQPEYAHPSNQHHLANAGSMFTQQPFQGNVQSVSPHQFFRPVHMTFAPSTTHSGVRPVVIQPVVQTQDTWSGNYPDENGLGVPKLVPFPTELNYTAYQGTVAPGSYGWAQMAPPDNVVLSEGIVPRPIISPENTQRVEDCHLCQKALPHAHSDPVAQEIRGSDTSSIPDATSVYHTFHPDDAMRIQPSNFTGQKRIPNHQEMDIIHKENVGTVRVQPSEHVPQETMGETPKQIPVSIQKENHLNPVLPHDYHRQLGGLMESLHINAPETYTNPENFVPPTEKIGNEGIPGDMFRDNTYGQPPSMHNTDHTKPREMLPSARVVLQGHESQPIESYEKAQSPFLGNHGLYPHSVVGVQLVNPSETQFRNSVYSAYDAAANLPSSLSSSNGDAEVKDSSNSLFNNQDPWNMQHDAPPPLRPNKIQIKKGDFVGQDHFPENPSLLSGVPKTRTYLQDRIPQSVTISKEDDVKADQSVSSKGGSEERIKQELQNVAEGVAASVLQSGTPSDAEFPSNVDESVPEANTKVEVSLSGDANQKDMGNQFLERLNFGHNVSDCLDQLQIIKDSDLEELRELGSGTFGTVYHGKWRGTDVAIKRINDRCFAGKPSEQERMIDDFWNEARKLAGLHHPNVVAFYGVVVDSPGGAVATVTEYMVNGSLRNALQKNMRNFDKRKRLLIAMDIAFGMEYLHGKNIVHFDLKSDNLLVNLRDPHRPICKVGDLGLSKVKCQTLISGGVRGTLPWMAPELLNGISSLVSEKVDVFSFGIVLWELLTGEEPYADLHYGAIIGGIVSNTLRPPIPDLCDLDWKLLMERCWSAEPSERPSFTEIVNELCSMA